jgi:D-glycero-alpha-D-manno-heptose-7-phosphate kinase
MIISQTPLRISFLGGGTDYPEHFLSHGGAVLGSAVDKFAFFSMSRFYSALFDYSIRISYRQVECVRSLDEIQHAPFRECLRSAGLTRDIEINHTAELPAFTGLGSSSSFVVGLLHTIHSFQGRVVSPVELAYEAIEMEREILRESVGCQDQAFAAVGGFNLIEFRGREDFVVHPVALNQRRQKEFDDHLLIFFTGLRRRAEGLAARHVERVSQNVRRLTALRGMVDEGFRILTGPGSLDAFGDVLHRTWVEKRLLDPQISNPTLDCIYEAGLEAGALGGKLLGAGAGGFFLFFVPPENQRSVRHRLRHLQEVPLKTNAPGSRIILGGSSETIKHSLARRERARARTVSADGHHSGRRAGHPATACPA